MTRVISARRGTLTAPTVPLLVGDRAQSVTRFQKRLRRPRRSPRGRSLHAGLGSNRVRLTGKSNLVVRTINEQLWATRKRGIISGREYTSKYKGVSWDEPRGKWKAQIQCEGRNRYIGRYDEEEDAALAYDQEARRQFGEHASLNFPGEGELAALPAPGQRGQRRAA